MVGLSKEDVESIFTTEFEKMKTGIMAKLTEIINEQFKSVNDNITLILQRLDDIETENRRLKNRQDVLVTENVIRKRQHARDQITLADLRIHSMKYNIIVPNIEESPDPDSETNSQLVAKLKDILKTDVKMNPTYVDSFSFKAAHRLGRKSNGKPRSSIFVFNYLDHVSDMWKQVKQRGKECKHHFNSHLPTELAVYKSELLKQRIDMRKEDQRAVIRVVEVKGYPQMEVKNAAGKFDIVRSYKRDTYGDLLLDH